MHGKTSGQSGTATGSVGTASAATGRSLSGRSRNSRSAKKIQKQRLTILGLSLLLIVTVIGWSYSAVRMSVISEDYHEYRASSRAELEQRTLNSEKLDRLREERDQLIKGLIPGLQPLQFDETIDVNDAYFRNIAFTLTGTSYLHNYEYRVVLHNDSLNVVFPKVTIFLFDERGIQVGATNLSKREATSKAESASLQPNETRAYTGRVDLNLQFEPKYFLVSVD